MTLEIIQSDFPSKIEEVDLKRLFLKADCRRKVGLKRLFSDADCRRNVERRNVEDRIVVTLVVAANERRKVRQKSVGVVGRSCASEDLKINKICFNQA